MKTLTVLLMVALAMVMLIAFVAPLAAASTGSPAYDAMPSDTLKPPLPLPTIAPACSAPPCSCSGGDC